VKVNFIGDNTSAQLLAASSDTTSMPSSLDAFSKVATATGTEVSLKPGKAVKTQYLLVWLTNLPHTSDGKYRGRISEIGVTS
jgi:hypothetical protein